MVSRPLVSILMPTHCRPDVIGFAIESVLAQTFGDFELLVVGDGAAPGTVEAIRRFDDPRIRFLDLPKAPHFGYANRNIALRESRGELIGFAADDDLLFPDHLEVLIRSLADGVITYSQALWVSTDGIAAPFLTNLEFRDEFEAFRHGNSIAASCFLYRADALPHRDAWPEDVPAAADWHLWHSIIAANSSSPISYCRTPTVFHFSARRKASRHSGMAQLAEYLEIADHAPWWPPTLRVPVASDKTEQQAYSELMRSDPDWCQRIRRDSGDLVARLAWDDILGGRSTIRDVSNKLAETEAMLAAKEAELAKHARHAESAARIEPHRARKTIAQRIGAEIRRIPRNLARLRAG